MILLLWEFQLCLAGCPYLFMFVFHSTTLDRPGTLIVVEMHGDVRHLSLLMSLSRDDIVNRIVLVHLNPSASAAHPSPSEITTSTTSLSCTNISFQKSLRIQGYYQVI